VYFGDEAAIPVDAAVARKTHRRVYPDAFSS
jgi:hypothetical protein